MVSHVVSLTIAIFPLAILCVSGTIYDEVGSCELIDALYIPGLRIETVSRLIEGIPVIIFLINALCF